MAKRLYFQKAFALAIFTVLQLALFAQTAPLPLNHNYTNLFEQSLHHLSSQVHTDFKPYNQFQLSSIRDSVINEMITDENKTWLGRKLFNEHLVNLEKPDYSLYVDPAIEFRIGKEANNGKTLFTNTRGFTLSGTIGKKFAFSSDFYENQALFPTYINNWIKENRQKRIVIPGQGIPKQFKDEGAYDYAYVNGLINYQPNKYFNFQFGRGKNFIGDGYRSLLLSDNAFNYPFFKVTTNVWKVNYTNLFSQMRDIRAVNVDSIFTPKYLMAHYFSINLGKRWTIGLYEGIVYGDSLGNRGLDLNYLNPVIFYRPIEFNLGSQGGNVLIGLNSKFKATDDVHFYGQFFIDEFKINELRKQSGWRGSKYGIQAGVKAFDLFGIPNLSIQSEVNLVRPYTYAHKRIIQNYAQYNQTLAHPLGANFIENVNFIRYRKNRFFTEGELLFSKKGKDINDINWGGDLYKSNYFYPQEYDNKIGQGQTTHTTFFSINTGFIINPKNNLRLALAYTNRKSTIKSTKVSTKTNFVSLRLSTDLNNYYYDF